MTATELRTVSGSDDNVVLAPSSSSSPLGGASAALTVRCRPIRT